MLFFCLTELLFTCMFGKVRLDSELRNPHSVGLRSPKERHGGQTSAYSQQAVSSVCGQEEMSTETGTI